MSDPLLNHPAVKLYRDHEWQGKRHFCPNASRRSDIAVTVKDLRLWASILTGWGFWEQTKKGGQKWKQKNPLDIAHMLDEYERIERNRNEARAAKGRRSASEVCSSKGLAEGSFSIMQVLQQAQAKDP